MNKRGQSWAIAVLLICLFLVLVVAIVYFRSQSSHPSPSPSPNEKPYEEIHVESIQIDETYQKLLSYMEQHPKTRLMLIVAYFPNATMTQTIRQRYAYLNKLNYTLGLHVHIAVKPEINSVPYEDQLRVIRYGRDFLGGLNISTTYFAPGYWSYNNNTMQACYDLGLIHFCLWEPLTKNLDTENWLVEVVPVEPYTHDWEL